MKDVINLNRSLLVALSFWFLALGISTNSRAQSIDSVGAFYAGDVTDGILVSGNYAYLGTYWSLRVIDISQPANPRQKGQCTVLIGGAKRNMQLYGDYLFVTGYRRCSIVDISDPASPRHLITFGPYPDSLGWSDVQDVYVNYPLAYLADHNGSDGVLAIYNISQLDTPQCVDIMRHDWNIPLGICGSGDYIYMAHQLQNPERGIDEGTLEVINVADPANPIWVTRMAFENYHWGWDVAVGGHYAFMACNGLWIIDISDPSSLILTGAVRTPGDLNSICLNSNFAYLACDAGGIAVADISDPVWPAIVATYQTRERALSIAVSGDYIYTTCDSSLYILHFNATGINEPENVANRFEIILSYPNPFNAVTILKVNMPQSGKAILSIYNLLGQKVATLWNGYLSAGEHGISWDASAFTSGVYFAKLETGKKAETVKMVLVK